MYYGYSKTDGSLHNARIAKGGTPLPHPLPRVRKHERIIHHHINNLHTQDYEFDDNGNMISVSVAKKEEPKPETENPEELQTSEDGKDVLKSFLWDEENRLLAVNNNGSVSCYFYDAAGERTVKLTSETEMVYVNGKKVGGNANICKFTAYVSPYFVVSNGGAYTKHIYAASQRIASKLGNV
ncbi:MAG: hypothetical protein K6E14_01230, partial [Paludibacteraceae bacterium]|nr:hypothetical protein [Paludibacteraceae bacterium]